MMNVYDFFTFEDLLAMQGKAKNRETISVSRTANTPDGPVTIEISSMIVPKETANAVWKGEEHILHFRKQSWPTDEHAYGSKGFAKPVRAALDSWSAFSGIISSLIFKKSEA